MGDLTNFALRMPPEIKEAAKALVACRVRFIDKEAGRDVWLSSINEALCYLMEVGTRGLRDILKDHMIEVAKAHDDWTGIMRFFLDNPSAAFALPVNFPEGSIERKEIEYLMELQPEDFADGFDRPWFTEEFASRQRQVWALTEAIGVVQKAIGARA